jgi:hypothetical protein
MITNAILPYIFYPTFDSLKTSLFAHDVVGSHAQNRSGEFCCLKTSPFAQVIA